MRNVTLTEQMGAMAIVDELRHRKLLVAEQLDLPQRRAEVARKIREYYQANGVASDDAVIERGVREFFATRLMYEQPKLGLTARAVLHGLVNRRSYLRSSVIGLLLCAVGYVSIISVQSAYQHLQASTVRDEASSASVGVRDLAAEVARQRSQLARLVGGQPEALPAAAARLVQQIDSTLHESTETLGQVVVPERITRNNYATAQRTLEASLQEFYATKSALWRNRDALDLLERIQTAVSTLERIKATRSYQNAMANYPDIRQLGVKAESALATSDEDGAKELTRTIGELQGSLSQLQSRELLTKKAASLKSTFDGMKLPNADGAVINAILGEAAVLLNGQKVSEAESFLNRLEAMIPFAERSLTFQVVSRYGEKSGVERIYSENGVRGQAYFAIAEAIDRAGNIVAVPFADVETDAQVVRKVFGVRISKDEFERLKEDKRDGHIDDRQLGTKPANALSIEWAPRTLGAQPDLLMNW